MAKKVFTGKRLLFVRKSVVEVADWDVFEPEAGEVLFESMVSLVSPGTELSRLHDTHTVSKPYPTNSGYLSAGRIARVGTGVTKFKPGDRVISGLGHVSHACFPEDNPNLVHIPDDMKLEDAVWAKLCLIPLWGVQKAQVRIGSHVAVFGLGVIGQVAAQMAKVAGGHPVIGVDICKPRLEVAESVGIVPVNAKEVDVKEAIMDITGGHGLDCVVEATGTPHTAPDLFDYCAVGATISILGGIHKPVLLDLYTEFQKKCLTMVGAHTSGMPSEADSFWPYNHDHAVNYLIRAIKDGVLDMKPYTSKIVSYKQGPEMFDALTHPDSGVLDVIFDWSEVANSSGLLK